MENIKRAINAYYIKKGRLPGDDFKNCCEGTVWYGVLNENILDLEYFESNDYPTQQCKDFELKLDI